MLPLLSDENFNGNIIRGMRRREQALDLIRVQDVEILRGASDEKILEWTANEGRILLTHDIKTVPPFVADRLNRGLTIAGVVLVPDTMSIGLAIEQLLLIALASELEEWNNRVECLPW
jgi:hypothetical protein